MLISQRYRNQIYVSIASYMDYELEPTIQSLLESAAKPQNLYISVCAQDNEFPDLDKLFKKFGVSNYTYMKLNYALSRGVGFARHITQQDLTSDYKYYLQVDSHTQFEDNWDIRLIKDYEKMHKRFGKMILSSYPPGYEVNGPEITLIPNGRIPPVVDIRATDDYLRFEAKYTDYVGGSEGQVTGYFCAGLAFGYSAYFLEVPYDPNIYFNGEEQTMSIRFWKNNTLIVCPADIYLYHDYVGNNRKRHWDTNTQKDTLMANSRERVKYILTGYMRDQYSIEPFDYERFADLYVKPAQSQQSA